MPPASSSPKQSTDSNYINLGFPTMIRKARWAAAACGKGDWRGLDAIVYSAFAIEAFVNDFATMGTFLELHQAPPTVRMAVKALLRAESKHRPTQQKVMVLYRRLAGTEPDHGRDPLQRVSLLFDLRDKIVHAKADVVTGQAREPAVEKLLSRLKQKGGLIPQNLRLLDDWRAMLDRSPDVAHWSLDTARTVALWIREGCPDSDVKQKWLINATAPRSAMFGDH